MRSTLNKIAILTSILIGVIQACNKPSQIGGQFISTFDNLNVSSIDTFKVQLNNAIEDTLRTGLRSTWLLGTSNDTELGTTTSSLYLQPDLPTNNFIFPGGDVLSLDSIVLMLDYQTYYGDTTVPQTLSIHEITESYTRIDSLNGFKNYNYNPTPIGLLSNVVLKPRSRVVVGNDTVASHLRIALDYNFGLNILSQSGNSNLANAEQFHSFFKGFYLNSDATSGGRCIYSFTPNAALTRLMLYYHSDIANSLSYGFTFNGVNGAFHNTYKHDYNGSLSSADLINKCDSSIADRDMVYLQSMQGSQGVLKMPTFKNLKNSVINKGVLEVYAPKQISTADSVYNQPRFIALDVIDSFCNVGFVIWGEGVTKTISGVEVTAYQFIFTNYLQEILDNNKNYTYLLSTYSQESPSNVPSIISCYSVNPYQVKLFGSSDALFKPRLFITSTLVN